MTAGRAFAAANDGSARADGADGADRAARRAERTLSTQLAADADTATRRAYWIAGIGFVVCFLVARGWPPRTSRAGS